MRELPLPSTLEDKLMHDENDRHGRKVQHHDEADNHVDRPPRQRLVVGVKDEVETGALVWTWNIPPHSTQRVPEQ